MDENREISRAPSADCEGRSVKAHSRTTDTHVLEKSDCAVLPVNRPNKGGQLAAEAGEGRAQMKENIDQPHMPPTQSGKGMSQGLDGVRKAARERKQERFTALLHHLSVDLLRDSFYALKRQASPGVDGVTWQEYETGLENRLVDLHSRVHRGAYRAQPSRRVYIPKADGRQRPLGIAALEDKIVQQAVVTILNQIYEVDFKGFSYGFRPGRSPHQALDALSVGITRKKVNWMLDADIRGFFDNLSDEWAVKFIEHRVADRRIIRYAGVNMRSHWLKSSAGVRMVLGLWCAFTRSGKRVCLAACLRLPESTAKRHSRTIDSNSKSLRSVVKAYRRPSDGCPIVRNPKSMFSTFPSC